MRYFADDELKCKHCGILVLHPQFDIELDKLRETINRPLIVLSGCRCKYYNDLPAADGGVGGHPRSLHVCDFPAHADKGQKGLLAIDLASVNPAFRGDLFTVMWRLGWSIGWNAKRGFLHGDRRDWLGIPQATFD